MCLPYKKRIDNVRKVCIDEGSGFTYATTVQATMSSSTPLSVPATTYVPVAFTAKSTDPYAMAKPDPVNTFTIAKTGMYLLELNVAFERVSTNLQRSRGIYLYRNGVLWRTLTFAVPVEAFTPPIYTPNALFTLDYLTSGDIIQAYVRSSEATTITTAALSQQAACRITYLGDGVQY